MSGIKCKCPSIFHARCASKYAVNALCSLCWCISTTAFYQSCLPPVLTHYFMLSNIKTVLLLPVTQLLIFIYFTTEYSSAHYRFTEVYSCTHLSYFEGLYLNESENADLSSAYKCNFLTFYDRDMSDNTPETAVLPTGSTSYKHHCALYCQHRLNQHYWTGFEIWNLFYLWLYTIHNNPTMCMVNIFLPWNE
jgi:hypothetical protein